MNKIQIRKNNKNRIKTLKKREMMLMENLMNMKTRLMNTNMKYNVKEKLENNK